MKGQLLEIYDNIKLCSHQLIPKPSVDPTLQALEKDEGGVMSAVYTKAVQGMVEKLSPNRRGLARHVRPS